MQLSCFEARGNNFSLVSSRECDINSCTCFISVHGSESGKTVGKDQETPLPLMRSAAIVAAPLPPIKAVPPLHFAKLSTTAGF
jgi:hypothetical protein